ncbi:MAG TPA: hypothetical protein DCM40_00965 [Maribacter sp.]|nr:hypothetical protein [Maribacter sp.]
MIALSHESLQDYYKLNFGMIQHHKWSLTEIDNMIPWEREIYTGLLINHLEQEKELMEKNNK